MKVHVAARGRKSFTIIATRKTGHDMIYAFVTVVLAGLGSIKGTLVSARILGQVISIGGTIWPPLSWLAPFLVMFFVILIRPTGLFGVTGKALGFDE